MIPKPVPNSKKARRCHEQEEIVLVSSLFCKSQENSQEHWRIDITNTYFFRQSRYLMAEVLGL